MDPKQIQFFLSQLKTNSKYIVRVHSLKSQFENELTWFQFQNPKKTSFSANGYAVVVRIPLNTIYFGVTNNTKLEIV